MERQSRSGWFGSSTAALSGWTKQRDRKTQQRDAVKAMKCGREKSLLVFVLGHPWRKGWSSERGESGGCLGEQMKPREVVQGRESIKMRREEPEEDTDPTAPTTA